MLKLTIISLLRELEMADYFVIPTTFYENNTEKFLMQFNGTAPLADPSQYAQIVLNKIHNVRKQFIVFFFRFKISLFLRS